MLTSAVADVCSRSEVGLVQYGAQVVDFPWTSFESIINSLGASRSVLIELTVSPPILAHINLYT